MQLVAHLHLYSFDSTLDLSGKWNIINSIDNSAVSLLGVPVEADVFIYSLAIPRPFFSCQLLKVPFSHSLYISLSSAIPIYTEYLKEL